MIAPKPVRKERKDLIDGLASVLFAAQVLANWNGAYLGKQKEAVEDFFKVELPEIDLKSKTAH